MIPPDLWVNKSLSMPKSNRNIIILLSLFLIILVASPALASKFLPGAPGTEGVGGSSIANYIKAIYQYAVGSVGILAAIVMMFGGILWITAGGNPGRVENAKSWIFAALTGLVIALTSYMILYMINPALVKFEALPVAPGDDITLGCCKTSSSCKNAYDDGDCTSGDFRPNEICNTQTGQCEKKESPKPLCCVVKTKTPPIIYTCSVPNPDCPILAENVSRPCADIPQCN
jgi:hypothetical protein